MSRWYVGAILEPSWNIQPVICLRDYSRFSVGATWCPADTTNHIRPLPCFYLGHCTADISTFCSNSWGKKKVGYPLVELTTYPPSQSHFLLRFPLHRHSPHIRSLSLTFINDNLMLTMNSRLPLWKDEKSQICWRYGKYTHIYMIKQASNIFHFAFI